MRELEIDEPRPQPAVLSRPRKSNFIEEYWGEGQKPSGVLCNQFYELKWSNGCLFGCQYCYLRGTFRYSKWRGFQQTVFSNTEEMLQEVDEFLRLEKPYVLHTGEVSDSLAVPGSEAIMGKLITRFGAQDKHTLLILTKSNNVGSLLDLPHRGRTVIGFSINPRKIAERFEVGAASTDERLEAAQRCIDAGYKVMVRVDPMIPAAGWRPQYASFFSKLNEMEVHGVVVGTLRAYPGLLHTLSPPLRAMLREKDIDGRWHLKKSTRESMYEFAFSSLNFERMGVCKETGARWAGLVKRHGPKKFFCNCTCNM